jgi:hypothetical protein
LRDIAYFDVGSECREKGINNVHTSDMHSLAELHAIKYRRSDLRPKGLSSAVDVETEKAVSGVGLAQGGVGRAGRTTCQNWKRCILNLSMGVKEGSQTRKYLGLMYTGCMYEIQNRCTAIVNAKCRGTQPAKLMTELELEHSDQRKHYLV